MNIYYIKAIESACICSLTLLQAYLSYVHNCQYDYLYYVILTEAFGSSITLHKSIASGVQDLTVSVRAL